MSLILKFPIKAEILYVDDEIILTRNTIGKEVTYNLEIINEISDLDSNA